MKRFSEVQRFQQHFVQCHQFLADNTHRLAELLREAESRGILLQAAFTLADVGYWLQNIDWQTKFLGVVLAFIQDPSRKTLRPLIELYGRDRDRMKVEAEILSRQLTHRLATLAEPVDAPVRKVITKSERRIVSRRKKTGHPSPHSLWLWRRSSGKVLQGAALNCLWVAGVV